MSSFKTVNTNELYINNSEVKDYVVDYYMADNAWCYWKYKSGMVMIVRNGIKATVSLNKKFDSLYYNQTSSWKIQVPDTKIVDIMSSTSTIFTGMNGLYFLSNRILEISSNSQDTLNIAWYIVGTREVTDLEFLISCVIYARYE